MSYTKQKNLPGAAVFLHLEKAFDSIEWNYLQKCLEVFGFGRSFDSGFRYFVVTYLAAYSTMVVPVNTFY